MAQVLARVPASGLEAVLVATARVLEATAPSGRISLEHGVNVMGRLQTGPQPAQVTTALTMADPPRADTARYDRLRVTDEERDHA